MTFDPAQHKARQRKIWQTMAAGWERWWATFEAGAQEVSDRLCDLARLADGNWVLDVGAGTGEPSITAAKRVGASGKVTAIDLSPEMLAVAERRARAAKIANLGTHVGDAETLTSIPEASYDAVLSRWALMLMPSPATVVASARRLLIPGGWFAAATWAPAERVPFISLAWDVVRPLLGIDSPEPGTPGAFALSDPEALARMFAGGQFRNVHGERLIVTFEYESPKEFARFVRECSSMGLEVDARAPERADEIFGAVAEAVAQQFGAADGRVAIPGETLLVAGRR